MLDLARRMPREREDLATMRGFDGGLVERHGQTLLDLIRQGRETPNDQWPREKGMPPKLSENQQALVDLLAAVLRLEAQRNAVNPATVASRKDLEKLVGGDDSCSLLKGWRKGLVGRVLADVLAGRLKVVVEEGRMVLQRSGTEG